MSVDCHLIFSIFPFLITILKANGLISAGGWRRNIFLGGASSPLAGYGPALLTRDSRVVSRT